MNSPNHSLEQHISEQKSLSITNISRGTTLSVHAKIYSSIFGKAKGLMFRKKMPSHSVIFPFENMPRKVVIHMAFVFMPLDVVWLDSNKVVLETKTLKPWSYHKPQVISSYVLELEVGTIKRSRTHKGDTLHW